jgi:hypothetical protein
MIQQSLSGRVLKEISIVTGEEVQLIQALRNPPLMELSADDLYVRKVRLAGDKVDEFGGCFRTEDLPRLLDMVRGLPLLIGHRKDTVGVARFFNGEIEEYEGANYIVPRFYWLKKHSQAEDLRLSIDGGIVSEASISFAFKKPTCSVCGEDIRLCLHRVGKTYMGSERPCFYYYDEIVRVNEGSLVYRGAEPGTGFELNLSNPNFKPAEKLRIKFEGKWFLATPINSKLNTQNST